ncbi:MAG: aminodeoxychorismate/anthranilate synthase component II [Crocinitomicaceae bacterium]|nr:aminodeoxychorismate/anthranilate synthase component II [Flavobacteriales bacterium]NQZ37733.1 aminodeoxychorismate/anthranilate synthase component II [Crocinitomicaceae bacterium]
MQQILLIDNFDSFTYNVKHYLTSLGAQVQVVRNNVEILNLSDYDKIVLSPGPGLPADAGRVMSLIGEIGGKVPVLGVCLGMQAISLHLGGEIFNQENVKHGVQESVSCGDSELFSGLPSEIEVGLYHSWAVKEHSNYSVTARSASGAIMAIENTEQKLYGVQFHPESIMTPNGMEILENFLRLR